MPDASTSCSSTTSRETSTRSRRSSTDPAYRLLRAEDADKALRLLLEHDVAAIVLDIKMPGVSGFELAQMIKGTKRFRQIPILFLTAHLRRRSGRDHRLRRRRGRLPDQAGESADPPPQGGGVRRSVSQDARARRAQRDSSRSACRERTAELRAVRGGAARGERSRRTSSSRRSRTSCAIRSRRCAPGSTSCCEARRRRPTAGARRWRAMNRQLDHMVRLDRRSARHVADQPRHARAPRERRRARLRSSSARSRPPGRCSTSDASSRSTVEAPRRSCRRSSTRRASRRSSAIC